MGSKIKDLQKALFENSSTYVMPPGMSKASLYKSKEIRGASGAQQKVRAATVGAETAAGSVIASVQSRNPVNRDKTSTATSPDTKPPAEATQKTDTDDLTTPSTNTASSQAASQLGTCPDITKNESLLSDANSTDSLVDSLSSEDEMVVKEKEHSSFLNEGGSFEENGGEMEKLAVPLRALRTSSEGRDYLENDTSSTPSSLTSPSFDSSSHHRVTSGSQSQTLTWTSSPQRSERSPPQPTSALPQKGNVLTPAYIHANNRSDSESIFSDGESDGASVFSDLASSEAEFYDSEDEAVSPLLWALPSSLTE